MKTVCERLQNGWTEIGIGLRPDELDVLINCLRSLKAGSIGHFHFTRQTWTGSPGIADIEISLKGDNEPDDMSVP